MASVIFDVDEVLQACDKVVLEGRSLANVFTLGKSAHSGPHGTKYIPLYCNVPGKSGRLQLRFFHEKMAGQISPNDDNEAARLSALYGRNIKKRFGDSAIGIQKINPEGQKSKYFAVIEHLSNFFSTEIQERFQAKMLLPYVQKGKHPRDAIVTGNPTVICPIQTHVSKNSPNAGQELKNPITRMTLKFSTQPGIYGFASGYYDTDNKPRFKPLLINGELVTAANIHHLKSKSEVSGIVKLDVVCLSKMGISIPSQILILLVRQPQRNKLDDTSVLGKLAEVDLNK